MAIMKQHGSLDWELTHVITSLPLDIERLTEILEAGADVNMRVHRWRSQQYWPEYIVLYFSYMY